MVSRQDSVESRRMTLLQNKGEGMFPASAQLDNEYGLVRGFGYFSKF